jgi:AcrR family transcriptional regulator
MVTVKNKKGALVPVERPGPPGGKRETNRRRRVHELCRAGEALFLVDGIAAVTVERITTEAGTSKGNFYRYFADKEALVAEIFSPVRDGLDGALDACHITLGAATTHEELIAGYQALGLSLGGLLLQHSSAVRLYLQEGRAPAVGARQPLRALSDRIAERAIVLTQVAQEVGLLAAVDPRVSALAVVGAVERLLWAVLTGEQVLDPTQVAEMLIGIVLDGMRPTTPAL